mmetsp:Transcript_19806/g.20625  ORF Transcript_19806/g.20625 Transcript_19806/m.20625 type:complete len:216 (-) Transcript_19806:28-675(-)
MKLHYLVYIILCFTLLVNTIHSQEPALKVNLNPPEENTKDTINALKDIGKLEDDLRIGANEDFDDEKKKMIEIQKTRIHDIVHGAFLGLNSLIPNPIKSSIRKAIRDHIGGKSSNESISDPSNSMKAVDFDRTNIDIRTQMEKIRKVDEPKFKQLLNTEHSRLNKQTHLRQMRGRNNGNEVISKKYASNNYSHEYFDNGALSELNILNSGIKNPL